jgi:hypothetical protein
MFTCTSRNMLECFYIQELGQRVDDELVFMYELHRRCTVLSKKKSTRCNTSGGFVQLLSCYSSYSHYLLLFVTIFMQSKCSHCFLLLLARDYMLRWDLRLYLRLPWLCLILVLILVSSRIPHFSYLSREGQDTVYLSLVNKGYSISCTYFVKRKLSMLPILS